MIWVTYTGKRILRNFAPVIALLAMPFVLVMLLSWLMGVTEHQRQQLEGFYKLPIICEVTDLHGNTGRPITYNYAYLFTEPGQPLAEYAKNVRLRKTLYFQLDG